MPYSICTVHALCTSSICTVLVCAAVCGGGSQTFTSNGVFAVPARVSSVRAVAMGGGAGGTNAFLPGGGSGYIACGTFNVTGNASIPIVVGSGGTGGAAVPIMSIRSISERLEA